MHRHHWLAYLAFLPSIVVLAGLVARLRSDRGAPADWYVFAHLGFLYYLAWWDERYWIPLAPFLIDYFFCGLAPLKRVLGRWSTFLARSALVAWIAMLASLNLYLVFKGNLSGTHGGLNPLVSPRADSFYKGKWGHLYQICQILKEQPLPGSVAVLSLNGNAKYARAFSGRDPVQYQANSTAPYLLADEPELPPSFSGDLIAEQGPFTLYRLENGQ